MNFIIFLFLTIDCLTQINDPNDEMIDFFKSLLRQSSHFRIVPISEQTTNSKLNNEVQKANHVLSKEHAD